MLSLWKSFDRLLEDFDRDLTSPLFFNEKTAEDGSFVSKVHLPGMSEKDIKVELKDGAVSVIAEKKTETTHTSVKKYFTVPKNCDTENLKAELKDGVLTISLPTKALPPSEVKTIPILTS